MADTLPKLPGDDAPNTDECERIAAVLIRHHEPERATNTAWTELQPVWYCDFYRGRPNE